MNCVPFAVRRTDDDAEIETWNENERDSLAETRGAELGSRGARFEADSGGLARRLVVTVMTEVALKGEEQRVEGGLAKKGLRS